MAEVLNRCQNSAIKGAMSNSPSKADQLRAFREAKASSGGKVRLQPVPQSSLDHGSREKSKGGESRSEPPAAGAKRGRPRIGEERSKPWEEYGYSRRTYFRRKKLGLLPKRKK